MLQLINPNWGWFKFIVGFTTLHHYNIYIQVDRERERVQVPFCWPPNDQRDRKSSGPASGRNCAFRYASLHTWWRREGERSWVNNLTHATKYMGHNPSILINIDCLGKIPIISNYGPIGLTAHTQIYMMSQAGTSTYPKPRQPRFVSGLWMVRQLGVWYHLISPGRGKLRQWDRGYLHSILLINE